MSTIASLLVRIGADTSEFQQAMGNSARVTRDTQKAMEQSAAAVTALEKRMKDLRTAVNLGAISQHQFKEELSAVTADARELATQGALTDRSVERLSRTAGSAERAFISMERGGTGAERALQRIEFAGFAMSQAGDASAGSLRGLAMGMSRLAPSALPFIGIGITLYETIKHISEANEKAQEAADKHREAFEKMINSVHLSVPALERSRSEMLATVRARAESDAAAAKGLRDRAAATIQLAAAEQVRHSMSDALSKGREEAQGFLDLAGVFQTAADRLKAIATAAEGNTSDNLIKRLREEAEAAGLSAAAQARLRAVREGATASAANEAAQLTLTIANRNELRTLRDQEHLLGLTGDALIRARLAQQGYGSAVQDAALQIEHFNNAVSNQHALTQAMDDLWRAQRQPHADESLSVIGANAELRRLSEIAMKAGTKPRDHEADKLHTLKQQMEAAGKESARVAESIRHNFESAFEHLFTNGLKGWTQFGSDIVHVMESALAKLAASKILGLLLGGPLGFLGLGGSAGKSAGLVDSRVFHAGGEVGSGGTHRAVSAMAFAGAQRMHSGGLAGDEVPAILQKGETVIPRGGGSGYNGPRVLHAHFNVGGRMMESIAIDLTRLGNRGFTAPGTHAGAYFGRLSAENIAKLSTIKLR